MRLRQLTESPNTAVFAFGRMNPPTIGHKKLVDKVKAQAGVPFLFLTRIPETQLQLKHRQYRTSFTST